MQPSPTKTNKSSKTLPTPNYCYKLGTIQKVEIQIFKPNSQKAIRLQFEHDVNLQIIQKRWIFMNNLRNKGVKTTNICSKETFLRPNHGRQKDLLIYTFSHLRDYYGQKFPIKMENKTKPKLFSSRPATMEIVVNAGTSLRINKTLGPCSTPAWALTDGLTEIVPRLTMVIIEYIKEQKVTSFLKKGLITCLYKKMIH